MRNKFLFRLLALSLVVLSLSSCKKDKDDDNANVIEDSNGLRMNLTWTQASGTAPNSAVDLDMLVVKSSDLLNPVAYSQNEDEFEELTVSSAVADGDYTLVVDHFTVTQNGTYKLTAKGVGGTKILEFTNSFSTADDEEAKQVLKISKSGNKFTVTKL